MDIQLCNISKKYQGKYVLKDINMTFKEGKVNCIMGASGIGKTTLLHIVMQIVKQDGGQVKGVQNQRLAAVFQEDRLIEHWDALRNVKLVCGKDIGNEVIEEEFLKVGLVNYQDKSVYQLSGGMRRRVALVRAMLAQRDIVVMDEPFQGLDDEIKKQVIEYVKERTKGKTVIMVTHDRSEAEGFDPEYILM